MSYPFVMRTSDRAAFKSCRRRWYLSSHLHYNRGSVEAILPLWTGTGFHFALEDYYGHKSHERASEAFQTFVKAWTNTPKLELPTAWDEDTEMAVAMLDYYQDYWLAPHRIDYPTLWIDGVPQVEVTWEIHLGDISGRPFLYRGTFDRVVVDEDGLLWVVEYKTAVRVEYRHYDTDQQTTAYIWAAQHIYKRPCAGVIYQQHLKKIPEGPKILATGRISLNKQQVTSYPLFKEALLKLYGSTEKFPPEYADYIGYLISTETEDRDSYVVRERIERNPDQLLAEEEKIWMEAQDMTDPNLRIYPNPTRTCGYCPFNSICVSMDDGSDWEDELQSTTQERVEELDYSWRQHLDLPNKDLYLPKQAVAR